MANMVPPPGHSFPGESQSCYIYIVSTVLLKANSHSLQRTKPQVGILIPHRQIKITRHCKNVLTIDGVSAEVYFPEITTFVKTRNIYSNLSRVVDRVVGHKSGYGINLADFQSI